MKKQPLKRIIKEEIDAESMQRMNEGIRKLVEKTRQKGMDDGPLSVLYALDEAAKGKLGGDEALKQRATLLTKAWFNFFSSTGPLGDLIRLASEK